jgi:hypothetical protein
LSKQITEGTGLIMKDIEAVQEAKNNSLFAEGDLVAIPATDKDHQGQYMILEIRSAGIKTIGYQQRSMQAAA